MRRLWCKLFGHGWYDVRLERERTGSYTATVECVRCDRTVVTLPIADEYDVGPVMRALGY